MKYAQSHKRSAQELMEYLLKNDILDKNYKVIKNKEYVFFPVKNANIPEKWKIVEMNGERRKRSETFEEKLEKILSKEELEDMIKSFDIVGDIAIIQVPEKIEKHKKAIANAILETNKNIKVVLKKVGIHSGEFRLQKMEFLAGEKRKETIHKENGVKLKLDVEKVYFSPRLSNERMRIAKLVRKNEDVLVMFSGCAPFCCVIAKNSKARIIYGIEKNKIAHDYGMKNLALNKIHNVMLINGDVKEIAPNLKMKFDRIVMPLPKSAGDFLDYALMLSRKNTIIHFYDFRKEGEFKKSHEIIMKKCKENNKKCRILKTLKCGQYSPRVFRICVDFVLEN